MNAFDSDAGTFGSGDMIFTVDAYLQIDFGIPTHMGEVRLKVRKDAWHFQAPVAFSLACSSDGPNWTGICCPALERSPARRR